VYNFRADETVWRETLLFREQLDPCAESQQVTHINMDWLIILLSYKDKKHCWEKKGGIKMQEQQGTMPPE